MREQYLEVHQTHPHPISAYEEKLSGSIMEIFGRGVYDLPGLIEGLNGLGLNAPDGGAWNEDNFRSEMRRLGN